MFRFDRKTALIWDKRSGAQRRQGRVAAGRSGRPRGAQPFRALRAWAANKLKRFQIAICRPGGDLLSHTLRCSTIGAGEFHGRVRDGIGWGLPARATRPAKRNLRELVYIFFWCFCRPRLGRRFQEVDRMDHFKRAQAARRAVAHLKWSFWCARGASKRWTLTNERIKPNELLVKLSFMRCRTSTRFLSTWWSSTALQGELVLRWVSRLDAFSGYPFRT